MLKTVLSLLLLSVVLISCCDCETVEATAEVAPAENEAMFEGIFTRTADNDRAGFKDTLFPITGIEFKAGHCQFMYDGTPMSGKCEVDNGFVYIETGSELGLLGLEIMNEDRLEGEGFAHGTFIRAGSNYTVETNGKEESATTAESGNSSSSTTEKSGATDKASTTTTNTNKTNTTSTQTTNTSNTTQQDVNPFGSGGGTGTSGGPVFGSGTGSGDSGNRKLLKDVDVSGIQSATNETITLQLTVNGNGDVIQASTIKSKTTTKDKDLIDKVISAVKSQVKYSKDLGASLKYVVYTVKVSAS